MSSKTASLTEIGNLKSTYNSCKVKVNKLEDFLQKEQEKFNSIRLNLQSHEEALAIAEEEIDMNPLPEGALPLHIRQNRDKLRLKTKQLESTLKAQEENVQAAKDKLRSAERALFEADKGLNQYVDKLEETTNALAKQEQVEKEKANRLARFEIQRAKKWEREQKEAVDAQAERVNELRDRAVTQIQTTQKLHAEFSNRVHETNEETSRINRIIQEMKEEERQNRIEAVLELKTNSDAVRAQVATQAAKHVKKVEKMKKKLDQEKADMIAQGLNPYAEFRRKEIDAEANAREKKLKDAVERNKAELAERMLREEETMRKALMKQRKDKAYEKKYRDELGRHVTEERNRQYIMSVTNDHREILDPTGAASRIDPSKITDIPDHSFGLGKSSRIPQENMKRITDRIRNKLKVEEEELGEYQRLVTGLAPYADSTTPLSATSTSRLDRNMDGTVLRSQSAPGGREDGSSHGDASTIHPLVDNPDHLNKTKKIIFEDNNNGISQEKLNQLKKLSQTVGAIPGIHGNVTAINFEENGDDKDLEKLLKISGDDIDDVDDVDGPNNNSFKSKNTLTDKLSKYPTVQLSKFEQDAFERAKEKQKNRQINGTTQIAGGRIFSGNAFVAKPSEIIFNDFEIQKRYHKKFILTNVSYTFNSFRFLPLTDDIIDFFEVIYEKPGRMSAGVSVSIEIVFTPKVNKDILSTIKLLSETGPIEIPLKCYIKKCFPFLESNVIECGNLFIGQSKSMNVKIKNLGALPSKFTVERVTKGIQDQDPNTSSSIQQRNTRRDSKSTAYFSEETLEETVVTNDPALSETELMARVQRTITQVVRSKQKDYPYPLTLPTEGYIDGYNEVNLKLMIAPLRVENLEEEFQIKFDGIRDIDCIPCEQNHQMMLTKNQSLTIKLMAEDLPIFLTDTILDLKCVLFDRVYRHKIGFQNRGTTACKVIAKLTSSMSRFIDISPSMVFVQSGDSAVLNLKFTPTIEILKKLAYFSVNVEGFDDAATMALPIEFRVVGQELPLYLTLKCDVCKSNIELSTTSLDFGDVYLTQRVSGRVTLTNTSRIAQKAAFVNLKKEVKISPNEGFFSFLPGESITCEVIFAPTSVMTYNQDISIRTSLNDEYIIKLIAEGVEAPLVLDDPVIELRPTCPGERVVARTWIRNVSSVTQIFEITHPDPKFSWMKFGPCVSELPPQGYTSVEIQFMPPENCINLDPEAVFKEYESIPGNPYTEISKQDEVIIGKGAFGELHWGKKQQDNKSLEGFKALDRMDDELSNTSFKWAIVGKLSFPIWIKSLKKGISNHTVNSGTSSSKTNQTVNQTGTMKSIPLFMSVSTVVTEPELWTEEKLIDFGQSAIGIRQIKIIRVHNNTDMKLKIEAKGLNAVGPYTVLNYVRDIEAHNSQPIMIECLPKQQGLIVEVLTISSPSGGHELRITLQSQGVKPSVVLHGLETGPPGFDPRGGLLDFGNVVVNDVHVKKFTIENTSAFPVLASVTRAICDGLTAINQSDFVQRTASGLPLFSIRPDKAIVAEGKSIEIEVIFRPDHSRLLPFREDLHIQVGQGDGIMNVCICARVWNRQLFMTAVDPRDEIFIKNAHRGPLDQISDEFDPYNVITSSEMRQSLQQSRAIIQQKEEIPPLILEYLDAYSKENEKMFADLDNNNTTNTTNSQKPKPAVVKGGANIPVSTEGRSQSKSIRLNCATITDGRPLSSAAGTYEVILAPETKESGLFSISSEKGSIPLGSQINVDIICTLPKPRGVSGLEVGTWQTYSAKVLLKGGWRREGEPDEQILPVQLKAFIRL